MISKEVLSPEQAAARVKEGQTVMVGGFMGCGSPPTILEALAEAGTRNMKLVCNDTGYHLPGRGDDLGVAINVHKKQFSHVVASHIGLNVEVQRQMNAGETEVTLVPQGTLAEQIRAAGTGLGGILTPTGVGTEVAEGKQTLTVGGHEFLLEEPIHGDVALLQAKKADKAGNLVYSKSTRNFGPLMAMACKTVIVEVEEIVEIGEIDPELVHTPSIFVDYLVLAGNEG